MLLSKEPSIKEGENKIYHLTNPRSLNSILKCFQSPSLYISVFEYTYWADVNVAVEEIS